MNLMAVCPLPVRQTFFRRRVANWKATYHAPSSLLLSVFSLFSKHVPTDILEDDEPSTGSLLVWYLRGHILERCHKVSSGRLGGAKCEKLLLLLLVQVTSEYFGAVPRARLYVLVLAFPVQFLKRFCIQMQLAGEAYFSKGTHAKSREKVSLS